MWRGALLLADLTLASERLLRGRTVVELGAGTGLAGIAAARSAAVVLLTDLPSALSLCRVSATLRAGATSGQLHGSVQVAAL